MSYRNSANKDDDLPLVSMNLIKKHSITQFLKIDMELFEECDHDFITSKDVNNEDV